MQDNRIHGTLSAAWAAARWALALLAALLLSGPFTPPLHAQTNSPPVFLEDGRRTVAEEMPAGTNVGAPIAATDDDNDPLTYSIAGGDAALFTVVPSTGQIRTKAKLNFEVSIVYAFTLSVHDRRDENGQPDDSVDATIDVQIDIENVNERGSLEILPTAPYVNSVVRARLTDPDTVVGPEDWVWERSRNGSSWSVIDTAVEGSYTPQPADQGMFLRARVTYADSAIEGLPERNTLQADSARIGPEKDPRPVKVEEVVTGLTIPWDLDFTPDRTMLFTQREGIISARLTDGTVQELTADMSDLSTGQEAGLMSIIVDPSFATNRRFYTCQAHTDTPGDETDEDDDVQVIAWTVNAGYTEATRVNDPLVGGIPSNSQHSGCRLRFGPSGHLWISTGDAYEGIHPQDLTSLGGKVLRVDKGNGAGAPGNPFSATSTPPGSPLVYTYGHRNVQGLALDPRTSRMWSVEHGPARDDEINVLRSGKNYGWDPSIEGDPEAHNEDAPMTHKGKFLDAEEAKWSSGYPAIATSGGIFLEGSRWGAWKGRLAVASLRDQTLRLFDFTPAGVLRSEFSVPELDHDNGPNTYGRIRSPVMGPDNALYITTSRGGGRDAILKVTPSTALRFHPKGPLERTVRPNAPARTNVGARIAARHFGGSSRGRVTYILEDFYFDIDSSTGQIRTSDEFQGVEGEEHIVTVSVHDGVDESGAPDDTIDDTVEVFISVGGSSSPPRPPQPPTNNGGGFGGGFGPAPVAPKFAEGFRAQREAFESAGAGDAVGEPVGATHPNDLAITYSLSGADASLFSVDEETGQIRVREGVTLTLGETYTVNLTATDTSGTGSIIIVEIVVVEATHHPYDANRNGRIDRDEVLAAVNDYFDGEMEKEELLEIVKLYFDDS